MLSGGMSSSCAVAAVAAVTVAANAATTQRAVAASYGAPTESISCGLVMSWIASNTTIKWNVGLLGRRLSGPSAAAATEQQHRQP